MEVTAGPLAPLNQGEITKPETWVLRRKTGKIHYHPGSNSPVLHKFIGKGLEMEKIKQMMLFAARRPCTLEFAYGYVRKIHDFAPVIIDVRVLPNVEWDFCETKTVWKVSNKEDFLQMLNSISFVAARNDRLVEDENFALVTSPEGSAINNFSQKIPLRSLFDIEMFSPVHRTFVSQPLL